FPTRRSSDLSSGFGGGAGFAGVTGGRCSPLARLAGVFCPAGVWPAGVANNPPDGLFGRLGVREEVPASFSVIGRPAISLETWLAPSGSPWAITNRSRSACSSRQLG